MGTIYPFTRNRYIKEGGLIYKIRPCWWDKKMREVRVIKGYGRLLRIFKERENAGNKGRQAGRTD